MHILNLQFIQTNKQKRNGLREKLRLVNKEECEICEKAWYIYIYIVCYLKKIK